MTKNIYIHYFLVQFQTVYFLNVDHVLHIYIYVYKIYEINVLCIIILFIVYNITILLFVLIGHDILYLFI